jgi:NADH-ubiquinone oxidoreductase chain 6
MYIEICSSLLYLIAEIFTNGHDIMILDILSLGSIISGISVIICKNPILSILFLIGLFACVATYLIFIGFNFIGLSYLIVYIGAVNRRIKTAALVKIQLYKVLKYVNNVMYLSWYFLE